MQTCPCGWSCKDDAGQWSPLVSPPMNRNCRSSPEWTSTPRCTKAPGRSPSRCWWTTSRCCSYNRRSCSCRDPCRRFPTPTRKSTLYRCDPDDQSDEFNEAPVKFLLQELLFRYRDLVGVDEDLRLRLLASFSSIFKGSNFVINQFFIFLLYMC